MKLMIKCISETFDSILVLNSVNDRIFHRNIYTECLYGL